MNEQQQALLQRCIKQLDLLKCEYAIITPDGTTLGALPVAKPEEPGERHNFRQYGYKEVCSAMQIGDTYDFDECVGAGKAAIKSYQSAIGSCLIKLYGTGSFTTQRVGPGRDIISVKRLA